MDIRHRWIILPVALLAGACQAADDAAPADGVDATVGIDALRASYVEHYNMGHPAIVADMYAEDAVGLMADGSVLLGREAIAAGLAEQLAASPELALTQLDDMAFGDTVVTIGTWSVTVTPEEGAEPVTRGGHYMAAHTPGDEGWQVAGVITNYDSRQPAEALQGTRPAEPPTEESTMGALLGAYEAAWNAGDAAGLAALYAEDAWAAFADLPAVQGRAAIEQAMEQRVRGEMDLHGVNTVDLGDGWKVDGGWLQITGDGDDFIGNYWIVTRAEGDGEPVIHWAVSNGRPASVIPSSDSSGG